MIKVFTPQHIRQCIQQYIKIKLGEVYISSQNTDLAQVQRESDSMTPIIFILTPGTDPRSYFMNIVNECYMEKKTYIVSFGQGQESKAENMLKHCSKRGDWLLMENCHFALSWMDNLDRLYTELDKDIHPNFRLWLTSENNEKFPL